MVLVYIRMNCSHSFVMQQRGFHMTVVGGHLDWLILFMSQDGCRFNNWMLLAFC